ncbi:MAG: alkaline phosphatase family protein [Peptococcaceae bacterium]
MNRKALSDKILILGVDGMDPNLTKRFVEEGIMPNTKKFLERGVAREDLVMQGGHPTITPPMWTTMATGTCPGTHGITCFWNQDHENLDTVVYALDSRRCKSEPLWNVFAEAGKKTLVWHWPGSAWPPTSDNPNLYVVDGTQPAAIGMGSSIDWEKQIVADKNFDQVRYQPRIKVSNGAGCVLTDVDTAEEDAGKKEGGQSAIVAGIASGGTGGAGVQNIELSEADGELGLDDTPIDVVNSPIKAPTGWTADVPADALEFTMVVSNGFVRRPCLILKNAQGVYDTVAVYQNKKADVPLVTITQEMKVVQFVDEVTKDDKKVSCIRNLYLAELAEDGSHLKMTLGMAIDSSDDKVWHPKSFNAEILENVGYLPAVPCSGSRDPRLAKEYMVGSWEGMCQYQSNVLNYCATEGGFDVIYSHLHNIDHMGHKFWHHAEVRENTPEGIARAEAYQECIKEVYRQTDRYIGSFLHLLDEDWSILVMSDHGLMVMDEEHPPLLGDAFGCNVRVMEELGYTVVKKDADGNDLHEIDWENTKAVATRGTHIWINLKGRDTYGIVEPEDKYALEDEIISALYNYRYKGERVVQIALRNKDAKALGMYGPECGDIVYFVKEGFNRIHGDAMTSTDGCWGSTVAPIVMFAGKGFKQGEKIDRIIQQVDFAATVAVLGGVRMTKGCEGAPVYQAFAEEF